MRITPWVGAIVILGVVSACNTTSTKGTSSKSSSPAETDVSNDQLAAMFDSGSASVAKGTSYQSGWSWTIERDGKGNSKIAVSNNGRTSSGSYRIVGSQLCEAFAEFSGGSERCFTLKQKGENEFTIYENGSTFGRFSLIR